MYAGMKHLFIMLQHKYYTCYTMKKTAYEVK